MGSFVTAPSRSRSRLHLTPSRSSSCLTSPLVNSPRSPMTSLVLFLGFSRRVSPMYSGAGEWRHLKGVAWWRGYSRGIAIAFVGSFLSLVLYLAFVLVKLIDYQSTNIAPANGDVIKDESEDYDISEVTANMSYVTPSEVTSCKVTSAGVTRRNDVIQGETDTLCKTTLDTELNRNDSGGGSRDSESELVAFRTSLNQVVDQVHRTLDNNVATPDINNADSLSQYDELLAPQRQMLCTALSGLAVGLRGAAGAPTAETHEEVDETVLREVQRYLGYDVPLGDATCRQPGIAQWDQLATTIMHKVVKARWEADKRLHQREEEKVRRDLTKLSNQCTITQLTDMMAESDDTQNSTFAETDNESQFSEQPEMEPPVTSTPRYDVMSDVNLNEHDINVDLDDLVALNTNVLRTPAERTSVISEPQRMSVSSVESAEMTIIVTTPEGETSPIVEEPMDELKEMVAAVKENARSTPVSLQVTEVIEEGSSGEDSDVTLGAESDGQSPVRESPITRSQATRERVIPLLDNDLIDTMNDELDFDPVLSEEAALRLGAGHSVPLPSFEGTESMLGLDEVDLDDISRHGDDEVEEGNTTMESEILFGCTSWDVTQPGPLFKAQISAYDNFGERKVGKDVDGPLLMMVPGETALTPTVGEQALDNLSDLSENEVGSETLSDFLSDSDDELEQTTMSTQTDDLEEESDNIEANVAQEYMTLGTGAVTVRSNKARMNNLATKKSVSTDTAQLELMTRKRLEEAEMAAELEAEKEEDPDDADPRFVIRPRTVTVPLGEPARITCQVTGTKPLDVFWYREGAEVNQLEEDEQTEVHTHVDRHTLELFNTTEATGGRYVCIAIGDKGNSHKTFRVKVTKSNSEQAAPEFLKEIRDAEVLEGSGASFRCKVKGRPQPRVSWYKDGTRLRSDCQYRIQKQGNRDYVLSIDCVTMDDDAEYTVVACNIAGEARTTVQLLVEAKNDDFGRLTVQPVLSKPRLTVNTETTRKYAALEEQGEREVASPQSTYPETAELLRIAEQVHTARTRSTSSASPVRSTAKLSSIHSQIDEMDKKLNSLEEEVHTSLITRSDSLISRSDSFLRSDSVLSDDSANNNSVYNMPVTDSLRQSILREHDEKHSLASSMRQVTSSALEVLTSSDTLMKAANSINQNEAEQTTSKTSENSTGGESLVIERSSLVGSPAHEEEQEELHLSYADFELLYQNMAITKEQLRSGKLGRCDGQRILRRLEELKRSELEKDMSRDESVEEEPLTSIDCGLKRVPSKRYKRDYIVNRSPVPQRRKLLDVSGITSPLGSPLRDVMGTMRKETLDDTEESIYLTSGKVFSLEDHVQKLQNELDVDDDLPEDDLLTIEDDVMRTSAQVTQAERQVSKIEKQVSNLQQRARGGSASSQSESPVTIPSLTISQSEAPPVVTSLEVIHGGSENPDDSLELPSVKNLRSLFNVDDGAGVRRVYSLTGRDLPKVVRDKLREQGPDVMASSNVRRQEDARKRQTASQVFSPGVNDGTHQQMRGEETSQGFEIPTAPRSSTPLGYTAPHPTPLDHSRVSSPTTFHSPTTTSSRSGVTSPTSPISGARALTSGTRPKNSTIMARAAFWDNRILEGKSSDDQVGDFPMLPQETFKGAGEY